MDVHSEFGLLLDNELHGIFEVIRHKAIITQRTGGNLVINPVTLACDFVV